MKMKAITLLIAGILVVPSAKTAAAAPASPKNVLLILVDDLNDWIEPLGGHPQAITPNMTRLAEKGMVFTNAHTSAAACHPSRVAFMTGVQPARSGVVRNVFAKGECTWREVPLLADAITMSQHFRDHGYYALCGGKIYHTLQNTVTDENDLSTWDEIMPGDPRSGGPMAPQGVGTGKNVDPAKEVGRRQHRLLDWSSVEGGIEGMADHLLVDWAAKRLKDDWDQPFFMAIGIFRPHLPWVVPQRFFEMYPLEGLEMPENDPYELEDTRVHGRRHWHRWVTANEIWKEGVQAYLASVTYADYEIGRLLDALEESGQADDTIIVFWSDHGMHIGEKENWEKFTCYEESSRIPLIIVDPGERPGVSAAPSASIDVFPTLVALTDTEFEREGQLDGESLAAIVRGGHEDLQPAITTYANAHAVRTDRYRYIFNGGRAVEELYDHQLDPDEHTNIAYRDEMQEVLTNHREWLAKHTGIQAPSGFQVPRGYERLENGNIRQNDFKLLDEVPFAKLKSEKKSK